MESWTCEVCQIQMWMSSRSSHLSGKRHAKAVQSRLKEADNSQISQSEPRGYVTKSTFNSTHSESPAANIFETSENTTDTVFTTPAVLVWECTLCGCYVESSTTREHLTSMEHVGKLLETIKITCQALEPLQVFPSDVQLQTYNHGLGIWETLDYQEAVHGIKTFGAYSSNPHLLNTEIPKSTNTSVVDPPKPSTASKTKRKSKIDQRFWTCPDCSTTIAIKRKSKHTCPILHEPAPPPVPPKSSLDAFFLSFPGYQYDPSKPPAESFGALQRYLLRFHNHDDWDGSSSSTWDEYQQEVFADIRLH